MGNWNVMTVDVIGNTIFAGTLLHGIFVSRDNGDTWTQTPLNNVTVYDVKLKGFLLFAATNGFGIYKSVDKGFTWMQTSLNNISVTAITSKGNRIFAATDTGILISNDDGSTWNHSSLTIPVYSIISDENFVFAGGWNTGVWISNDDGVTWHQRNEGGLDGLKVIRLFIYNDYLFAGTETMAGYRRRLDDLTGITPISSEIPNEYVLYQNYPNPFNPRTKIRLDIPNDKKGISNVKLAIFDVLGRETATLVNKQLQPGTYEINFDGSKYSSGIYYYKLITDGFSQVKKMVIMK